MHEEGKKDYKPIGEAQIKTLNDEVKPLITTL